MGALVGEIVSLPSRRRVAKEFGRVLRSLRNGTGKSQEDVAADAKMDRTYPSLLENGRRTPTLGILFNLARALDIKAELLVALTARRLAGSSAEDTLDNFTLTGLVIGAVAPAVGVDATAQAQHCDRLAAEIERWAKAANDPQSRRRRRDLAQVFQAAANAWRRKGSP
jgi:transcriptional regulator with XRE-family HTH domain